MCAQVIYMASDDVSIGCRGCKVYLVLSLDFCIIWAVHSENFIYFDYSMQAVRRLKTSPLTAKEMECIQEVISLALSSNSIYLVPFWIS